MERGASVGSEYFCKMGNVKIDKYNLSLWKYFLNSDQAKSYAIVLWNNNK